MFAVKRHLDDNALIRRYLAERGLDALEAKDEALLRHLAQCPSCGTRYAALQAAYDETRTAASEEADAVCSPSRMERQRDRILRRIEALSEGPRVLTFPAAVQRPHADHGHRVLGRWVAAAAVAGLVVGLTVGQLLDGGGSTTSPDARRRSASAATAPLARPVPVMRGVNAQAPNNEDQFLSEVELATAAPRAAELRAIYAFTLEESRDMPRPGKD